MSRFDNNGALHDRRGRFDGQRLHESDTVVLAGPQALETFTDADGTTYISAPSTDPRQGSLAAHETALECCSDGGHAVVFACRDGEVTEFEVHRFDDAFQVEAWAQRRGVSFADDRAWDGADGEFRLYRPAA